MGFHGLDAQAQAVGDFPGGFATHDQPQDFQLTGCQVVRVCRGRRAVLGPVQRLGDHGMGDGRAQVALIVTQGFQRLFQFGGRGVLE
ncbi:hypothetical protein D3C76_1370700 [compost metagenome]